jgi:surfactin synthase thioesterase subunit
MTPRPTLFCIPHAGGGASSFRGWADALQPAATVAALQLPGREARIGEPCCSDLDAAVDDLRRAVAEAQPGPFALFGHSLGGLLAFELALRLQREGAPGPQALIVSACRPPGIVRVEDPFSHLPDEAFVRELMARYGGIPAPILADAGFMAAIMPSMRADFSILERYRLRDETPLACPIAVVVGRDDHIARAEELSAWSSRTTGGFSLEVIEGDHFYLQSRRREIAAVVRRVLGGDAAGSALRHAGGRP